MTKILERGRERLRGLSREIGYVRGPRLMSSLRKWWVLLRHQHANVHFTKGVYLGPGLSLHIPDNGSFIVGPGVEFRRGFRAAVSGDGKIQIGRDAKFTHYVLIQCSTRIDIGERAMFGQSTIVLDGAHRFRDLTRPMLDQGYDFKYIYIADDATITTKCTIMDSVGERAFIGANSVVTRPIPAFTVAVGAPARPIEYFGPPGGEPEQLASARSASASG